MIAAQNYHLEVVKYLQDKIEAANRLGGYRDMVLEEAGDGKGLGPAASMEI